MLYGRHPSAKPTLARVHESDDPPPADRCGRLASSDNGAGASPPRGKIGRWNTGRGNRVVGHDLAGCHVNGHEAVGNAATNVLGHLGSKIPIQRFFAAGERRTIMLPMQRFEAKRGGHSIPNSLRCLWKARRRAGVGSGGLRMASTKRR
jgi:hypothetical protein